MNQKPYIPDLTLNLNFLEPDPHCQKCKGSGEMDSGGQLPWGEWVMVRCDCTRPECQA